MAATKTAIEVKGLRKLNKTIKTLADEGLNETLKATNKEAAETVATAAKPRVPRLTGLLAATLRTSATVRNGAVRVGNARIPYAKPIHFGWPKRNISPNPFLYSALDDRKYEIERLYQERVGDVLDAFNRVDGRD